MPTLRFPGFTEEWQEVQFCDVVNLYRGSSPRPIIEFITHSDEGVNWVKIGDMPTTGRLVTSTSERITLEGSKKSRKVSPGDLILSNSMTFGQPYVMAIEGYIHDGWFVLRDYEEKMDRDFLCNLLISPIIQKQYYRLAAGGVVQNISSDLVNQVRFSLPSIAEQLQISHLLNILDERIALQSKLIEDLKKLKSAIRANIFQRLKNAPTHTKSGAELLLYEQPTKYIVEDYEYSSDKTQTPVLTANKSLILGYTSENFGVYDKGNCIILDDFTLDMKFITFPFKVKSSAIKILTAKCGVNLRFIFEQLQWMGLTPLGHNRHYISMVEPMQFYCPSIEVQRNIAQLLDKADDKLRNELQLLELLIKQKSFLLSAMFI
ncbi:restriction endonuclease subunit S [uncultured Muribaculum sp.]|uniref:restriction endonuclease subunit S n=2 Tax=Muribaculaceae TaxID=2005473 RepID=UPI00260B3580|nr:restriction endonuclease subunit S [uncultured Muribaculum sp.]